MSLFKKSIAICLALVLALGVLTTASAAPGGRPDKEGKEKVERFAEGTPGPKATPGKPDADSKGPHGNASLAKRRGIVGVITSESTGSITVDTKFGSVTIVVNDATKYRVPGKSNATLADIPVNSRIAAHVTHDGSTITALAINLIPGKPQHAHRVGKVTAISDTSITIANKKNETSTFTLNADTKYLPSGEKPKVGDTVTVVANRVPSDQTWTAKAVVLHKADQD